jgi:hypothetical protein
MTFAWTRASTKRMMRDAIPRIRQDSNTNGSSLYKYTYNKHLLVYNDHIKTHMSEDCSGGVVFLFLGDLPGEFEVERVLAYQKRSYK